MNQSVSDRSDGEELRDTKVVGVYSTDSQLQPFQVYILVYDMGIDWPADYAVNF